MDKPDKRNLEKIRKLSFLEFSIQRSMGVLRVGSNPCTKVSPEWTAQLRLRNLIDCNKLGFDQLLFNEDGSLLVMADHFEGCVRLFDTKRKQLVRSSLMDLKDEWMLWKIMMSGPNEVATFSAPQSDSRTRVTFWDLRKGCRPVASSIFDVHTEWLSSVYSKKDNTILIVNPDYSAERLAVYNREGVKLHTGPSEASKWTRFVKNVALSPDESILVMETWGLSYIIIRHLNLETLFQDLQQFDPIASWAEDREDSNSVDPNSVNGRVRSRALTSRNVPEIMKHSFPADGFKCPCHRCNKAVVFSPTSEFFIGCNKYFQPNAMERGGAPSRAILTFDLREHLIQRRKCIPHPQLGASYDTSNLGTKSYLNEPLHGFKIVEQDFRSLHFEQESCCSLGTCNIAVTTLIDRTLLAIADDLERYIKLFLFNDEHFPVQEL